MLSGLITIVLGLLQVGKLLRLLPASVMIGFVNGLSIIVFHAQVEQFKITVGLCSLSSLLASLVAVVKYTLTIVALFAPCRTAQANLSSWCHRHS
jgi:SulP family sulfate permease